LGFVWKAAGATVKQYDYPDKRSKPHYDFPHPLALVSATPIA